MHEVIGPSVFVGSPVESRLIGERQIAELAIRRLSAGFFDRVDDVRFGHCIVLSIIGANGA